ncbi:hypothetical protein FRACYDRAFT_252153 [Fragilariopsis cylindrus CCMP1102]|uniref:Uncharacterized protein n=1 Tax=Fragilariopsis cylindrus CCMP1102 TaxID=635003 RepID=A0A1E7EMD1_9STRA|nr:hypothetical protein FRACYDRAFT_252153 [Fragilariopsis cylindrus CCMP1102]|eukprot:OEU07051.1 hypothetical protein FRACYDRAFT_252153 [Fragilariopsis cylindrus CCMP1102]
MTLETHEIVGCFGRLADKAFVLPPTEVEGTSASGYEFGVLESGRPKWLCTYTERSGQTQGGGAELCHVPTWCSVLFPAEAAGLTKSGLNSILQDETTKFEMPLGASPMAKKKASGSEFLFTSPHGRVVAGRFFRRSGRSWAVAPQVGLSPLTMDTVSSSLQQAATGIRFPR